MKKFIFIIALMLISINLYSSPPDSCLKYFFDNDPSFTNPDSVKVDSCLGSPTYGKYYGKNKFNLTFNYNIIPRTYLASANAIIDYNIDSIDNKYIDAINDFTKLMTKYGSFKLREILPDKPDTTTYYKRFLFLIFDKYVPIKEVESELNKFSCIEIAGFTGWFGAISDVNDSETQNENFIYPNPVSDFLMIRGLYESQIKLFSIYNTLGQKLFESELTEQIDVSYLKSGVYFLRIGNMNYKFVKL